MPHRIKHPYVEISSLHPTVMTNFHLVSPLTALAFLSLTGLAYIPSTRALAGNSSRINSPSGLNLAALEARKLYFGTATNNVELNDTAYFDILDDFKMFGQITPAKGMKWVRSPTSAS